MRGRQQERFRGDGNAFLTKTADQSVFCGNSKDSLQCALPIRQCVHFRWSFNSLVSKGWDIFKESNMKDVFQLGGWSRVVNKRYFIKAVNHKPPYHCKQYFLPAFLTSIAFLTTHVCCPALLEQIDASDRPKKTRTFGFFNSGKTIPFSHCPLQSASHLDVFIGAPWSSAFCYMRSALSS